MEELKNQLRALLEDKPFTEEQMLMNFQDFNVLLNGYTFDDLNHFYIQFEGDKVLIHALLRSIQEEGDFEYTKRIRESVDLIQIVKNEFLREITDIKVKLTKRIKLVVYNMDEFRDFEDSLKDILSERVFNWIDLSDERCLFNFMMGRMLTNFHVSTITEDEIRNYTLECVQSMASMN